MFMARKAVAMPIELARKAEASMPSFLALSSAISPMSELDLLLLLVLRPGNELLVRDHLRRHGGIDALSDRAATWESTWRSSFERTSNCEKTLAGGTARKYVHCDVIRARHNADAFCMRKQAG